MSATLTPWKRSLLRAALGSILVFVAACGDDNELPPNNGWPTFDSAVTTPDAGGSGSVPEGGTGGDAGVIPDGSVTPDMDSSVIPGADTGVATPDTGVVADGGMDATLEPDAGDAALDAQVDGSLGDAGDSAIADAGDAAIGDAGPGDAGSDAGTRPDQGKGDGKDVVLMGDSWMNNTLVAGTGNGIGPSLIAVSRQPYRDYGKQGAKMLSLGLFLDPPIPDQWDQAVRAGANIKTVIMTGGGNDVILGSRQVQDSCAQGTQLCKDELLKIANALTTLWNKMATGGVRDIVHVMYANVANGDNLAPALAQENLAVLKTRCANVPAPARCHLFDTNPYVRSASDLVSDGIHPSAAANRRLAEGLLEFMTEQGMRR